MRATRSIWQELQEDLQFGLETDGGSRFGRIISNRGFQAIFCYRIAHRLSGTALAILGHFLTRLCQMAYSIDIDSRASIAGGVIIYHGVGLVIGQGVKVARRAVLFHGVTLGFKRCERKDGFPSIGEGVVIGTGAKILGPINVGANSIVGANVVLTRNVPPGSIVRVEPCRIESLSSEWKYRTASLS